MLWFRVSFPAQFLSGSDLAILFSSRYQFNPNLFQVSVTAQILLKALTNLPHTDFTLCKCMIDQARVSCLYSRITFPRSLLGLEASPPGTAHQEKA